MSEGHAWSCMSWTCWNPKTLAAAILVESWRSVVTKASSLHLRIVCPLSPSSELTCPVRQQAKHQQENPKGLKMAKGHNSHMGLLPM
eukprot:scaffold418686_cov33-Prasinocladus_malaysianus.AAC.1